MLQILGTYLTDGVDRRYAQFSLAEVLRILLLIKYDQLTSYLILSALHEIQMIVIKIGQNAELSQLEGFWNGDDILV
ncbi:hypothetical protein MKW98_015446 [Papaver atlanticum]|uniref:Uncharacterized protein n=1 Tax=Papaver atlanticum TaxID=357466 RepID=A0AAD4RZ06_9MAGN|nr:hypothetical protein MKW98_015446 [Papaver atlanticum]